MSDRLLSVLKERIQNATTEDQVELYLSIWKDVCMVTTQDITTVANTRVQTLFDDEIENLQEEVVDLTRP